MKEGRRELAFLCLLERDRRWRNGTNTLALAVYDTIGKPRLLRAMVPLGVLEDHKIMASAGGQLIAALKYKLCNSTACFAEATISDAILQILAGDGKLQLTLENQSMKNVTFNLPLAGFQIAFEGDGVSEAQARQIGEAQ